ncbi:MAG: signal peptidase II [Myxococcota bacterium]|jgi:signal peptidase II
MKKYILFAIVTALSVLADQLAKLWVVSNLRYRVDEIEIIPGLLSFVHAQNRGAAFGIMQGQMLVFAVFTVLAIGVLGQMLWQLDKDDRFQSFALAMIASGAIGNAIDRARLGYVTDFIRVYTDNPDISAFCIQYFGTNEWPSFNIADATIVVGLLMFLFHYLFLEKDDKEPEPVTT